MGMTIDEARTALGKERKYALHENKQAFDIAIDTMKNYQMMELDYKARLRADMVAMLTELQLEIEEMQSLESECDYAIDECIYKYRVTDIIQQKINDLAEGSEKE